MNEHNRENIGVMTPGIAHETRSKVELGIFVAASLSRGISHVIPETTELRGMLPDPVDVPNHIANAAVTAGLIFMWSRGYYGEEQQPMPKEEYNRVTKRMAYAAGTIAVAANTFGELIGYGGISTPDAYDFAYGLAGGYLGYRWSKPHFTSAEKVQYIKSNFPEDHPSRRRVMELIPDPVRKQKQSRGEQPRRHNRNQRSSKKNR